MITTDLVLPLQLWNTDHHPDDVEKACQKSLDLLGLQHVDLYLIHWPMAYKVRTYLGQGFPT